jgi:hypothetical protein
MGFVVIGSSPEAMAEAMTTERKRWSQLVRDRNIRQE